MVQTSHTASFQQAESKGDLAVKSQVVVISHLVAVLHKVAGPNCGD